MPALAAAIITALGWAMRFLVAKVLLALGLQMAYLVGMDALLGFVIDQAFSYMGALNGDVYAIVRRCRIPDAIAVISAAALVKHSLVYGAGKLMFVSRSAG